MDTHSESPSPADLAAVAGGLIVGLTTLTIQVFPLAVPLLILVIGPLAVLGLAGLVLAIPILLPLWLGRLALRALRGRGEPGPGGQPDSAPYPVSTPRGASLPRPRSG
jgi:hypothetical protein